MKRLLRPFTPLAALLVSIALLTSPARAGEEPPVVRALLESSALSTAVRPTYASLDVAPDGTITLSDYKATYASDEDPDVAMTYEVETVVLAGVTEIGANLFEVADAEWTHITVASNGESIAAIPLITARSLYIHQPGPDPTAMERIRAANLLAREFAIPEALVLVEGEGVVLEGLSGIWDGDPTSGSGTSQFRARRIHIPEGMLEGDGDVLAMAGYSELELALEGTTITTYSDDAVGFDLELRLDGRDMGSLIVELGADGIPLALFGAVDGGDPDADELLAYADGVALRRARIRFEDDSLTGRLLSLMAEAEGTDVATFVADGTEGIDMMLAGVLEPELARQVSTALTTYLNDPRSITFELAPARPVHFAEVMAGLQAPLALIRLLQARITAND